MRLIDLPVDEKPREKAIKYGFSCLSNAELLALILRTGNKEKSAIELSYELLSKFNGLDGLNSASFNEICAIKGLKEAKALALMTLIEYSKRVSYKTKDYECYNSPKKVYEAFEPLLSNEPQEKCIVICLNSRNLVIKSVEVAKGSMDFHTIHPRDIYREALKCNSRRIILVHNHPSGDPSPSEDDIITTKEIAKLGKELGINLIEHVIISKGSYFSLKSNGLF